MCIFLSSISQDPTSISLSATYASPLHNHSLHQNLTHSQSKTSRCMDVITQHVAGSQLTFVCALSMIVMDAVRLYREFFRNDVAACSYSSPTPYQSTLLRSSRSNTSSPLPPSRPSACISAQHPRRPHPIHRGLKRATLNHSPGPLSPHLTTIGHVPSLLHHTPTAQVIRLPCSMRLPS